MTCLDASFEARPLPAPTPIPAIRDWAHLLHTHTHEEFASIALLQKDHTRPPCMDVSGAALIRPSQIHHYFFGKLQGTLEIQESLEGILRLLQLDPSISLLQQPEIDQILCIGEALTRWTRARHFPPPREPTHASILTCCGPWHNGSGHFVTFNMCQEYWSIIDPLEEDLPKPPRIQYKLHRALRESFTSRTLLISPLPAYRQLLRIAIQRDAPRPLWPCGTFAMPTTLHLLLGGIPPHSLPTHFITREYMLAMHRALLKWLIHGTPPPISGIGVASIGGSCPLK
jgi:hypothetical protein